MPAAPARRAVACLALGALATGGACASESDAGGATAASGSRSVSGYLAALPAFDGTDMTVVTYGDLARAAEIAGIERPVDVADSDAFVDYLLAIQGQGRFAEDASVAVLVPEAARPGRFDDHEAFAEELGWSILEVDSFAERSTEPRTVALLDGEFDGGRLGEVLDEVDDGRWVAGDPDGDLDINLDETTVARPLGETLWLRLDDDRLAIARQQDDVVAAGERDGGDDTLADDPALAPLGAALDDHDVYSAILQSHDDYYASPFSDRALGPGGAPEQRAALDEQQCEGMTGVAAGVANDGEPLVVLALAHEDEASAEANLEVLDEVLTEGVMVYTRRPWSEMLTVESVEAEGTVVVATARPAEALLASWYRFVYEQEFPPC